MTKHLHITARTRRLLPLGLVALLLCSALASTSAYALQRGERYPEERSPYYERFARDDYRDRREESRERMRGGISLEQAVAQVRRNTGGRILAAETREMNGRSVHRIKVLTAERQVRIVEIDAGSGR